MAIRGHQLVDPYSWDLSCTANGTGEMGGVVCVATGSYTTGMDNASKTVSYVANPSGRKPMGVLMQTVKDYDTSDVPTNFQNYNVVPLNSKVALARKFRGRVNNLHPATTGSITPAATMYLGPDGKYTTLSTSGYPVVGRFESAVDTDGFCDVSVNID